MYNNVQYAYPGKAESSTRIQTDQPCSACCWIGPNSPNSAAAPPRLTGVSSITLLVAPHIWLGSPQHPALPKVSAFSVSSQEKPSACRETSMVCGAQAGWHLPRLARCWQVFACWPSGSNSKEPSESKPLVVDSESPSSWVRVKDTFWGEVMWGTMPDLSDLDVISVILALFVQRVVVPGAVVLFHKFMLRLSCDHRCFFGWWRRKF